MTAEDLHKRRTFVLHEVRGREVAAFIQAVRSNQSKAQPESTSLYQIPIGWRSARSAEPGENGVSGGNMSAEAGRPSPKSRSPASHPESEKQERSRAESGVTLSNVTGNLRDASDLRINCVDVRAQVLAVGSGILVGTATQQMVVAAVTAVVAHKINARD